MTVTPRPLTRSAIDFAVDVRRQHSTDSPPRLEIAVENAGSREWTYPVWPPDIDGAHRVPFDDFTSTRDGDEAMLYLIPDYRAWLNSATGDHPLVPAEPTDGCWEAAYDFLSQLTIGSQEVTLGPGGRFSEGYTVVDAKGDGCMQAGPYPFATTKDVTVDTRTYDVELGFDFHVDEERRISVDVRDPTVSRSY